MTEPREPAGKYEVGLTPMDPKWFTARGVDSRGTVEIAVTVKNP